MITGSRYLLRGETVTVEVQWHAPRKTDPDVAGRFPLLALRRYGPRNVLVRYPDGRTSVRPFRGLRKVGQS